MHELKGRLYNPGPMRVKEDLGKMPLLMASSPDLPAYEEGAELSSIPEYFVNFLS